MSLYRTGENIRYVDCEFGGEKVIQRLCHRNSLGEPVWGCMLECQQVCCEYNLNPENEALRYNVFGKTSIW